jgi:hypothetical protein
VRLLKALSIPAICLLIIALAVAPAAAHHWPVFGFSAPGLGFPAASLDGLNLTSNYTSPLPGTYEWGSQPTGPALPGIPGIAYDGNNIHHGAINFGPFGYGSPGLSQPGGPGRTLSVSSPSKQDS